ncbi:Sad1-interacting factor 3 [Saitoella coloradoensis]
MTDQRPNQRTPLIQTTGLRKGALGQIRRPAITPRNRQNTTPDPRTLQNAASRLHSVSVESLLASTSEIPSARRRAPAGIGRKDALPQRTTKTSQKLVLLPESSGSESRLANFESEDEDAGPPQDDEPRIQAQASKPALPKRSYSERLTKHAREERSLPRVTAYAVAEGIRFQATAKFLRERHSVRPRVYDECIVMSSPEVISPGGGSLLEQAIQHSEDRDHSHDYFAALANKLDEQRVPQVVLETIAESSEDNGLGREEHDGEQRRSRGHSMSRPGSRSASADPTISGKHSRRGSLDVESMLKHAEMFVFNYGVIVFWNFSAAAERDILADFTFAKLYLRPLREIDVETEELHFEYSPNTLRPRIFNDMITLRSGDHMIKLAMSHAIAQSTKMSLFEGRMETVMEGAQSVPRHLALTGELGLTREQVIKMSGRLFKLRVDVNLSSNVLDTPEFFWDSEPALNPLYTAVREYLELRPRILVLNERCQVIFDLLDILTDSTNDTNMSRITLIIILLILVSIALTTIEVVFRFRALRSGREL